jgi:hypothetical protein
LGTVNTGPRIGPVVISEFMYQPASGDPNLEFVEILNTGDNVENLAHWRLTGDVDFTFPTNQMLAPGQALAVLPFNPAIATNATRLATFRAHYGIGTNVALGGGFLGSLPNAGGGIRLWRPDDPPIEEPNFIPLTLEDEVNYAPTFPWPTSPAGGGPALTRLGPDEWGNAGASWTAATGPSATPGIAPLADQDADGLPDSYEWQLYGGLTLVGGATGNDTDGDKLSDTDEYTAGSDATNAASGFRITITQNLGGTVALTWPAPSASGSGYFGRERHYAVETSTNLHSGFGWNVLPGLGKLAASGGEIVVTNLPTAVNRMLRVRVWLE